MPRRLDAPRLRLFCFPYAGGSATLFRDWPPHIPADVEVVGVQLPGRAFRLKEPPMKDMVSLLDALELQVEPYLDQVPFVFWGHSMGALLVFELMRRFQKKGAALPKLAILSARRAPHLPKYQIDVAQMDDEEFINELRKLGGTPDEIINNKRLMKLVLPSLRADFELMYRWEHVAGDPLSIPLKVVGGKGDAPISEADLQAWSQYSTAETTIEMFEGDHFYLHQPAVELLPWLSGVLSKLQV